MPHRRRSWRSATGAGNLGSAAAFTETRRAIPGRPFTSFANPVSGRTAGAVASDQLNGSAPGTFSWGGFFYTYFWVDPKTEVAGVLMTQLYPSGDLTLRRDFQRTVYQALETALDVGQSPGPQPGDVYREYTSDHGGGRDWRVTDPRATAEGAGEFLPNPKLRVEIDDLEHAIRAAGRCPTRSTPGR